MSRWKVQLFELNYDERERRAAEAVLQSGWITMGERTIEFEQQFAAFLGHDTRAVAVSSGTAALHMALLALGIGPGDEVVLSGLTFVADLNVVRMVGATPVLADCTSFDDWNADPEDISRKITSRTKAVLVVHYAGYPCAMERLQEICVTRGVALIEDSAHAIGATWHGQACGTFGDIACFSFFTNKNLSVGEGGMLVTRSESLEREARHVRSHGMTTLTLDRHLGRAVTYDVVRPGLNYRIDEIRAALGLVQLEKLPDGNRSRRLLTEEYRRRISDLPGVTIPFEKASNVEPSYHILPVLLESEQLRSAVIARMHEQGIQASIHYPSMRGFSSCTGLDLGPTPIADEISGREMTLPLYPTMPMDSVRVVVSALHKALA